LENDHLEDRNRVQKKIKMKLNEIGFENWIEPAEDWAQGFVFEIAFREVKINLAPWKEVSLLTFINVFFYKFIFCLGF
jgi:hypothetical protein